MISIVVPTFNRAASLQTCLESIISQYYEGLELVVIDDLSTDDTRLYLDGLSRHEFIKVIYNSENRGVNYSRNRGIEAAAGKFILFLDSDDALLPQSLDTIRNIIKNNSQATHFLFWVSDRAAGIHDTQANTLVQYRDWVSGTMGGDFTHVVAADIMRRYLFFEAFRRFEHLNWIRVKKETAPQLLIPLVVTQRQRDRKDSLTTSGKLINGPGIKNKFESQKLYYSLYYQDLKQYNPASLTTRLIETVLLGIASNQKKDSLLLLQYAGNRLTKITGYMLMVLPSFLIKYVIIGYSRLKLIQAPRMVPTRLIKNAI